MKKRLTRRQALGLIGAGTLGLGVSQIGNRSDLTVERLDLQLPRWDADGFRIGLISDLHMDSPRKADLAIRAANLAAREKPDVLLIAGDLVTSARPHVLREAKRGLREILELGLPTYAVLGNHENWTHDVTGLIRELSASFNRQNARLLRNDCVDVGGVVVYGIDDGIAGRDRHDVLTRSQDKNVVTLFHEPDFVDRIDARASLMVAGHSHGGQVCLPFGVVVHTPRGAKKYTKGYYRSTPVPLYVSRGVGTVGPSVRMFCPPEVTLLTLTSAKSGPIGGLP